LPVAELTAPLLRERVYCYELYHQLRCILRDDIDTGLVLTGEPDKQGNPSFPDIHPIPDFVLHEPGSHKRNRAVVEVECRVTRRHLCKDLKTFKCLQGKGYQQFILLLFGVGAMPWAVLSEAAEKVQMRLDGVSVLLHSEAGSPACLQMAPSDQTPNRELQRSGLSPVAPPPATRRIVEC
jgi:hypothetical protein